MIILNLPLTVSKLNNDGPFFEQIRTSVLFHAVPARKAFHLRKLL